MSEKTQHKNILLAISAFTIVVIVVAVIGFVCFGNNDDNVIQGEVEVSEYRVSSKLPGRIAEICVTEGDFVHKGDTLAILDVPEVEAQKRAAEATQDAAKAVSDMADNGARKEQIQAAYQLWQQAVAASDIAEKTYKRLQNLYNEGVISAQKRDEAFAAYKATQAQVLAAKSQYDMAKSGARNEERKAASDQANAAKNATADGEVSEIFPKVGELVGLGSPIMSISEMNDMWGTFNIREDQLNGMKVGDTFKAYCPAFDKEIEMKVYHIKDQGSFAVWKATKTNGQYDIKTFEVKARPSKPVEGLRPGMTLIIRK